MNFLAFEGKTAIVTGGGSNIGRAIVLAFAREGASVANAEIDKTQGEKVVKEANTKGGAMFVETDVTDWVSVQAMVKQVLEKFGKIDILVNCVGWVMDRPFIEKPREEWEKEIARNFWSDINCIRAVLDDMIQRKYGRIIIIGSDAGRIGQLREVVYSGCKGGVVAMGRSLARELGRYGITVNSICPGITLPESREAITSESMWAGELIDVFGTTEAVEKIAKGIPMRRLGTAEDIANAVLFFASDRASFITGQTISVDGGYAMM